MLRNMEDYPTFMGSTFIELRAQRFCCKNWGGTGEGLVEVWGKGVLGCQPKQAINEFDLILDSPGWNLSLPNHVHRLVAL